MKYDDMFPPGYLKTHYYDLYMCFIAYIGARWDITPDEATCNFVEQTLYLEQIERAINQGKVLLKDPNFPLESIIKEANIPFENEAEAKEWLSHTIELMERKFEERKLSGDANET